MDRVLTRPRLSTAVLFAILAVVVAGTLLLNPAPLRHRHNQLSGLTYEVRPADHRGRVTLIVTSVADAGAAARAVSPPATSSTESTDALSPRPPRSARRCGATAIKASCFVFAMSARTAIHIFPQIAGPA